MHSENTVDLGDVFTMLKTIGEHPKSECLGLCDSFIARPAVRENARQIRDFADPATVIFALDLNRKIAHWLHRTT